MDTLMRWFLALAIGLIGSFADFDCEGATSCSDMIQIVAVEIDQDGNTLFSIYVPEFDGSDSNCERFGACLAELIGSAAGMGAVDILNFHDHWVPSMWKWVDITRALTLAGEIDMDEYAQLRSN